jgi:lipopolysaccharide biosynthesis regulator YciM
LHERAREWHAAAEVAGKLERSGTGSFATRIAHHWCELALEADAKRQTEDADAAMQRARDAAPQAARPLILSAQRALARGAHAEVLRWCETLAAVQPAAFNLVAADYAEAAIAAGEREAALARLQALYRAAPGADLLGALNRLAGDAAQRRERIVQHLHAQPSLSAAQALLAGDPPPALDGTEAGALREAIAQAARPLQRYRCAACGFEAQRHFWQCPGCLSWDTYPPQRIEEA